MSNFTTKSATILLATAISLSFAVPSVAADPTADTVVAVVNGTQITLGEMIATREALPEQYQSLPDDVLFTGVLEQIIQQTVLAQEAQGKLTRRDELMMANQKRAYMSAVVLDGVAQAAVTDEAVQKLYDEKYVNAEPSKEYHAAHILVATEDEAKAIVADLEKGGDFAAIAKEKSTDPGSAANGGDLGWFGTGMMVKPFEDAVIVMEPGSTSAPVKSDFGWHIIKLDEVRAKAVPPLDDVKAELSGDLQQKAVEDKVTALVAAAKVEKSVDGIAPAVLKDTALIGN